ncbi:MAG: hypothetical protein DHS80DRAFT_25019 [Piptocephalis tieghemiana]|nr:MAG: hypothetical protein DHS80DRAFT_25019 [Piptocephalis tieghemiana]
MPFCSCCISPILLPFSLSLCFALFPIFFSLPFPYPTLFSSPIITIVVLIFTMSSPNLSSAGSGSYRRTARTSPGGTNGFLETKGHAPLDEGIPLSSPHLRRPVRGGLGGGLKAPSIWTPELGTDADVNARIIASFQSRLEAYCIYKEERLADLKRQIQDRQDSMRQSMQRLQALDKEEEAEKDQIIQSISHCQHLRVQLEEMTMDTEEARHLGKMVRHAHNQRQGGIRSGRNLVKDLEERLESLREQQFRRDRRISSFAIARQACVPSSSSTCYSLHVPCSHINTSFV